MAVLEPPWSRYVPQRNPATTPMAAASGARSFWFKPGRTSGGNDRTYHQQDTKQWRPP